MDPENWLKVLGKQEFVSFNHCPSIQFQKNYIEKHA